MGGDLEQRLLDQLELLFRQPVGDSNLCGKCVICCTSEGVQRQNVTDLELALLRRHYGAERAEQFAVYARRQRDEDGNYLYQECPNLGPEGCRVYPHRPLSCRVFGGYRTRQQWLPPACVFHGNEVEFEASDYYQVVPLALELRHLSRDFQMLRASFEQPGAAPEEVVSEVGLNLEDPFDRALHCVVTGQSLDASRALPAESDQESVFAHYIRALVASELSQHPQALRHYLAVLAQAPERDDLMTFAGFHAFQAADPRAESLWLAALERNPDNPLTHSFLGYFHLQQGNYQEAADFFGQAARLQPDQPLHQQRCQQALAMVRPSA